MKKGLGVLAASVLLAGCLAAPEPRPVQPAEPAESSANDDYERAMALLEAMGAAQQRHPQEPSGAAVAGFGQMGPEEVAERLEPMWAPDNQGARFERRRDGFLIDGVAYVEPQGEISSYGFDTTTGAVTYLMAVADREYQVRTANPSNGLAPVTIAHAERGRSNWSIRTVTGETLRGSHLMPTSRGFAVARDENAFIYAPGEGVSTLGVPDGFHLAAHQNGDIASTGYILIERNRARSSGESMMRTMRALGDALGGSSAEDYALINYRDQSVVPINISSEGGQVSVHSECRQRNSIVNECANMHSFESLYDPRTGRRNEGHYFWRLHWFGTEQGPIAVSHEAGLRRIAVTRLDTGEKAVAFSRGLGIASMDAEQHPSGRVKVTGGWAFRSHELPDAFEAFDKNDG
ncbi:MULTISPECIES: hypothetical protein [Thioalkalivibrio]|uniref:hypothetical protein n=1 Tax=Thioalkalivibrio TaxID=106633 RepID=UPI001E51D388|nr:MULTISPECIES: hypothetical protein [Thioalkalivibrio]